MIIALAASNLLAIPQHYFVDEGRVEEYPVGGSAQAIWQWRRVPQYLRDHLLVALEPAWVHSLRHTPPRPPLGVQEGVL